MRALSVALVCIAWTASVDAQLRQEAYVKAANSGPNDVFGRAIALSGDTMVIGAVGEASLARGVNGDPLNNGGYCAGAAYVFVRSGAAWAQQSYLKASNTDPDDFFATSVAISGDTIVVGASSEASKATGVNGDETDNSARVAGAAYVFVRNGTSWSQQAYLKASNTEAGDAFGAGVAISGDFIVVGAPREDSAATGIGGAQSDNSASLAGAAYVFERSGTTWRQVAYLKASNTDPKDSFGSAVAISGDTIVIGALGEASDARHPVCHPGCGGNNYTPQAGAAYAFVRSGTAWAQQAYLKASYATRDSLFGISLALDRDTLVVGASHESSNATGVNGDERNTRARSSGAAYVFERDGSTWRRQAYLKASNTDAYDQFGRTVAISGDRVLIGARHEASNASGIDGDQADNSARHAGAAYLYTRLGSRWNQQAYLKASNMDPGDEFGWAVGLTESLAVVGAHYEDSGAQGVNGNQGNSASQAGAAYVFHCRVSCATVQEVGEGCRAGSPPPSLAGTRPILGRSVVVTLAGAPSLAPGITLAGLRHEGIALGAGCTANVDVTIPTIAVSWTTDAVGGWRSPQLPVGTSASLLGLVIAWQAGVQDPATPPMGLALSNGVWFRVGY